MFNSMFGGKTPPTQEPKNPPAVDAKDQIKPNGMNPADPNAAGVATPDAGNPKPAENPLDAFKGLYDTAKNTAEGADTPARLELTDEVMDKVIPSLDFSKGLSPEVQQQLAQGDSKAFMAAIQQVGANAYKTAMQHNAALMNDHLDKRFQEFKPTIQKSVASNLTSSALSTLPNADNPVVKAELDRVASQLQSKYPDAPPEWIAKQTNVYLSELGKQLSGPTPEQQQRQNLPESVDFAELLRQDK